MKRFKPIELQTSNPQTVFDEHKMEISKRIIEAIDYGVRNKKKKVTFAKVFVNEIVCISLSVGDKEYLDVIDKNIQNLIEFEEYEVCALGIELKEKLSKK